jgi:hypothetical protein
MSRAQVFSARLAALLSSEHHAMADFLVALAEFDRGQAWVELGHASLFSYLNRELRLSTGAAFYRQTAARLIQEFPEVVEPLKHGRLCLTTIVEVSKVVTRDNVAEVLPRFFGKSKQEAKQIAAELSPQAVPTRTVVTPIAVPSPAALSLPRPVAAVPADPSGAAQLRPDETLRPTAPAPRPSEVAAIVVEPKTPELSRMHLTVSRRLLEKLSAARDALSFSHPGATEDEVIEAGLDLLLERAAKRRGIVKNPRKTVSPSSSASPSPRPPTRNIPASESRAVWLRDEGKCQWPLASGGVCGSTVRVSIHHKDAWAKHHGPPVLDRLMLACAFHQDLAARQDYGGTWMDQFTRGRGAARPITGSTTDFGPAP